jgi:hypothetical protein
MTRAISHTDDNPFGYGAETDEQLQRYLTRKLASPEEVFAATVIRLLHRQVQTLHQELEKSRLQSVEPAVDEVQMLKEQLHELKFRYEQDRFLDLQRIQYCLLNDVLLADGFIFVRLEQEEVVDGDYRAAIDKLMAL